MVNKSRTEDSSPILDHNLGPHNRGSPSFLDPGGTHRTPPAVPMSSDHNVPPPDWYRIPQKLYDRKQRQRDFREPERIHFVVDSYQGVNVRDALDEVFTGFDGRDDPVLQDAGDVISIWLSVRLL